MSPKFIMTVGIPGSGKSTWAKEYCDRNPETVWLSSDRIRGELYGDEGCQDEPAKVFQLMNQRLKNNLSGGNDVIYDATNISAKRRIALIEELKNIDCQKIAYVFAIPFEVCLRRNWMRERKVPDEVLVRMYKNWYTPYYFEGWDKIYVEHYDDIDFRPMYKIPRKYNQNNPHHKLTLGSHMSKALQYVYKNTVDAALIYATSHHDMGKPFCRFEDEHGVSHYCGHECVGAYDLLAVGWCNLEESALINYHMRPLNWESDSGRKDMERCRKLWGESFFNKVMLLHEADKNSHGD